MKAQTAQRGFPAALLTFSAMLLVLALGFVIGRVIIAPAYLGAAPKIDAQAMGGSELSSDRNPPGRVYVPAPASRPLSEEEGSDSRRERGVESRREDASAPENVSDLGEPLPGQPAPQPGGAAAVGQEGSPGAEATPEPEARREERSVKIYSIQVGVFASLRGARETVDELARGGYPARISPDKRSGQTLYRVVTGRYQSEYAARKALEQLRSEGFEAFLVEQ